MSVNADDNPIAQQKSLLKPVGPPKDSPFWRQYGEAEDHARRDETAGDAASETLETSAEGARRRAGKVRSDDVALLNTLLRFSGSDTRAKKRVAVSFLEQWGDAELRLFRAVVLAKHDDLAAMSTSSSDLHAVSSADARLSELVERVRVEALEHGDADADALSPRHPFAAHALAWHNAGASCGDLFIDIIDEMLLEKNGSERRLQEEKLRAEWAFMIHELASSTQPPGEPVPLTFATASTAADADAAASGPELEVVEPDGDGET
jgi:hypothetical protein